MRTYGRTGGRERLPNFLGLMDLPNSIAMDAPPTGAGAPLQPEIFLNFFDSIVLEFFFAA